MRIQYHDHDDILFSFTAWELDALAKRSGDRTDMANRIASKHRRTLGKIPIANARRAIQVTGGWLHEDVAAMSERDVHAALCWLAAGSAYESGKQSAFVPTY